MRYQDSIPGFLTHMNNRATQWNVVQLIKLFSLQWIEILSKFIQWFNYYNGSNPGTEVDPGMILYNIKNEMCTWRRLTSCWWRPAVSVLPTTLLKKKTQIQSDQQFFWPCDPNPYFEVQTCICCMMHSFFG